MPRFTNGKMGLVFPVEDHRKPNIIRGGGSTKPTSIRQTFETSFRQAISSGNNHHTITFPGSSEEFNSNFTINSTAELDDEEVSNQQVLITGDDFQQYGQPQENSSDLSSPDQLVQASIQTESGNYIMFLRDNEILELRSAEGEIDGTSNGAAEQSVEEDAEHEDGYYEEAEAVSHYEDEDEISTAVQHIQPSSESEIFAENGVVHHVNGHNNSHLIHSSESTQEGHVVDDQYVVVQLEDGNNYLIPASSLASAGVTVSGAQNQIFVDANGDQFLQVAENNNEVNVDNSTSSHPVSYVSQTSSASSRPKKRENSSNTTPKPAKRASMSSSSTNGKTKSKSRSSLTSNAQSLHNKQHQRLGGESRIIEVAQVHSPSSSTSSSSSLAAATVVRKKPFEDLKPRPFRFDMPEDELLTNDPSTDYLSLVIEQFQREHYVHK